MGTTPGNVTADNIHWYDTSGVEDISAPWDGTALNVAAAVSAHAAGIKDVVVQTSTDTSVTPNVTTKTYTQYQTNDTYTLALKVIQNGTDSDDEYHVYTPEAMRYVMTQFTTYKGSMYLENNMNMNGANSEWGTAFLNYGQHIYGQGHTIYNLRITTPSGGRCGFVTTGDGANVFDSINFQTGYIVGDGANTDGKTALFGYLAGNYSMTDVHANDFVVVGLHNTAVLIGRGFTNSISERRTISHCSVTDSLVFGNLHVASLTGCQFSADYSNSYTVGCTVISTGSHSGGFVSCGNSVTFTNCFTDVELYGSADTGVFTGLVNFGTCSFTNCYASGFVEGTDSIGGFIGTVTDKDYDVAFTNCYSTALVGLRSGGKNIGGFAGKLTKESAKPTITMTNCYAAGEVGSTDTDVSPKDGDQPKLVGGFIGDAETC